jgi:FlaG/FlaF family flagellin (archaellin)
MNNEAKESAVSEVVGVILMVAITVIMATIIAAYASGMMQGIQLTRSVIVTVEQSDPSHISVTYRGGPDNALLESLTIKWPDGTTEQNITSPKIGTVVIATNIGSGPANVTSGSDRIMVIGHFRNNKDQIVLDTMV